jgi:hypothetical protein
VCAGDVHSHILLYVCVCVCVCVCVSHFCVQINLTHTLSMERKIENGVRFACLFVCCLFVCCLFVGLFVCVQVIVFTAVLFVGLGVLITSGEANVLLF